MNLKNLNYKLKTLSTILNALQINTIHFQDCLKNHPSESQYFNLSTQKQIKELQTLSKKLRSQYLKLNQQRTAYLKNNPKAAYYQKRKYSKI